jgi:hypothetical protein
MSMEWIIITEFEVYKTSKLTDEIKKAHSDGVYDIVRLDDGLLLSDDGKNWIPLIEYIH